MNERIRKLNKRWTDDTVNKTGHWISGSRNMKPGTIRVWEAWRALHRAIPEVSYWCHCDSERGFGLVSASMAALPTWLPPGELTLVMTLYTATQMLTTKLSSVKHQMRSTSRSFCSLLANTVSVIAAGHQLSRYTTTKNMKTLMSYFYDIFCLFLDNNFTPSSSAYVGQYLVFETILAAVCMLRVGCCCLDAECWMYRYTTEETCLIPSWLPLVLVLWYP